MGGGRRDEQGLTGPEDRTDLKGEDIASAPFRASPTLDESGDAHVVEHTSAGHLTTESPGDVAAWPLPEELLRNRREWAKIVKNEHTRRGGGFHASKDPKPKAPAERDPPQR